MSSDDSGSLGWPILKGMLIVLGALAAIGIAINLLAPLFVIAVVLGMGVVGYKVVSSGKKTPALEAGEERRALAAAKKDADRALKELEALKKSTKKDRP